MWDGYEFYVGQLLVYLGSHEQHWTTIIKFSVCLWTSTRSDLLEIQCSPLVLSDQLPLENTPSKTSSWLLPVISVANIYICFNNSNLHHAINNVLKFCFKLLFNYNVLAGIDNHSKQKISTNTSIYICRSVQSSSLTNSQTIYGYARVSEIL